VEEDDLTASLPELLEEQDLIGILASQPVRAQDGDDIDDALLHRVAESVQARPIQAGARVSLVNVDVF